MHVFVTGATGVLGTRLVEELAARGHDVTGLVRDDAGAELVTDRGGTPLRGDVLEPATLAGVGDVDIVAHAATALPTDMNPSEEAWALNDRVRLEGARNLVETVRDAAAGFYFPSVVWIARQPDGSVFDADAQRHPTRATRSAAQVEDYLTTAGEDYGFDPTVLRFGFFYAPDAAHTREFGRLLLDGKLPIVGGGVLGRRDAELSLIHADDAGRAFAAAVDDRLTGRYHVVDDEPVTVATLFSSFADRLDTPTPRRIPGWLARVFVGKETAMMLTRPSPTTNDRFRAAVGWAPEFPTYREGLPHVIEAWLADGTLRETADGYTWTGA